MAEQVRLLAHPSKQLEYEKNVPIANVPAELICGFCVDLYSPKFLALSQGEKKHIDFINYDSLKDYINFGRIRIEDNILITEKGPQALGDPIPKTLPELKNAFNL